MGAARRRRFSHRSARFLLKHGVIVHADADSRRVPQPSGWLERAWGATHPFGTGGVYPNFPDPALDDPERAYWGANLERLRRVKTEYDPHGLLPGAVPPRG